MVRSSTWSLSLSCLGLWIGSLSRSQTSILLWRTLKTVNCSSFFVNERKLLKMALTACHKLQNWINMKIILPRSCRRKQNFQFLMRLQGVGVVSLHDLAISGYVPHRPWNLHSVEEGICMKTIPRWRNLTILFVYKKAAKPPISKPKQSQMAKTILHLMWAVANEETYTDCNNWRYFLLLPITYEVLRFTLTFSKQNVTTTWPFQKLKSFKAFKTISCKTHSLFSKLQFK